MNKALLSAIALLSLLQGACNSQVADYGEGRYANCVDLGTLALPSFSRLDAEQRMRARVEELGGDMLLFGERGRSELIDEVPEEIARRRDQLGVPAAGSGPIARPVESIGGEQPVLDIPAEDTRTDVKLWYYGAALRCRPAPAATD